MRDMLVRIKEFIFNLFKIRLFVMSLVMLGAFLVIIGRLYYLQIVKGEDYAENYSVMIQKNISVEGTRGKIYDRNGVVLAYNELSYSVTLEDTANYTNDERPVKLNAEANDVIEIFEENGDEIINDLGFSLDESGNAYYTVSGTELLRFKADVFGHSSLDEFEHNDDFGFDEEDATAEQIFTYLLDYFGINTPDYTANENDENVYERTRAYKILVIRYELWQNSYTQYMETEIATDISEKSAAALMENSPDLPGIEVVEDTKRVYTDAEYFSHIIGYVGDISTEEYEELSAEDDSYTLTDVVGKSGIEQVMETELQGKKGSRVVYVNNVGKVMYEDKDESTEASAGNDVYLSIDANLQSVVYNLLEQEIAGIVYGKIVDSKETDDEDLNITIYSVYNALIENNVIDSSKFETAEEGTEQRAAYEKFLVQKESVKESVQSIFYSDIKMEEYSDAMLDYITYILQKLQSEEIFLSEYLDDDNEVYIEWLAGGMTLKEYLTTAIESGWIDITQIALSDNYSTTEEIFDAIANYTIEGICEDDGFGRLVYTELINSDSISGSSICLMLFEQGVLTDSGDEVASLQSGAVSAYEFIREKIKNLDITPAQLALDPCTGSCVIMDPNTGELLACVSYPGYDNNRLTNNMDSAYYNSLLGDLSMPLYNYATQQTTAPGSTFKMVTASAALTEGTITADTTIKTEGTFTRLGYDLDCWVYPENHGTINVVDAIADSCNYFFCEVGYQMSLMDDNFVEERGTKILNQYASEFGLGQATGIETGEGTTQIADEYPIAASIGQANHNFTTIQLCRYVAAIANEGTVYNLSLIDKVTDFDGELVKDYSPTVRNTITNISESTWSTIKLGMRGVVTSHTQFDDLNVLLAGKTGTAQEIEDRPNHALFIGFAPYDSPQVAIAARIAYGYSSSNACDFVDDVMKYYFGEASAEELITSEAAASTATNGFTD